MTGKTHTRNTLLRGLRTALAAAVLAAPLMLAAPMQAQILPHDATVGLHPHHIYPTIEAANGDIRDALAVARKTHKRVILDFGGDWCGDCQVLFLYFHQAPNQQIINQHFIIVPINVGHIDANLDIAKRYGVPAKGVPALAVLNEHGRLLYSQGNNEFSDMRHMDAQSVTAFLNKWKQ
ncbi:Thiol-disulfide isomerase or thioredoxin [Bryocella elongata]|uniref:Thiol-disulfide isomerase or thioredoxin n=1 Tax=Bryocella elongata TaxID=863522 RepID=A0A1H6BW64_9BACT|nr:thioredoxin family protein [Bryocella elongata]SEG64939.1 Thiol-disulfide isomerase or thioredoxin [Bryocella elongata]